MIHVNVIISKINQIEIETETVMASEETGSYTNIKQMGI